MGFNLLDAFNDQNVEYGVECLTSDVYWFPNIFKMDFFTLVQRFKILFSLCGVEQFGTCVKISPTWKEKFTDNIPAFSYSIFVIVLYYFGVYFRIFYHKSFASINSFFTYAFLTGELLLHISITGHAIICRENLVKLFRTYDSIQKYMAKRVNCNVDFKGFQERLNQLIVIIFVPFLASFLWRIAASTSHISFWFNIIVLIFFSLSSLVQLHIIVHVELLRFFLNATTHWLRTRTSEFSMRNLYHPNDLLQMRTKNGHSDMLHLKWIHFKLWETSININRIYGWSLAAMIFRNTVDIANGAYWVYLLANAGFGYNILMREKIVRPQPIPISNVDFHSFLQVHLLRPCALLFPRPCWSMLAIAVRLRLKANQLYLCVEL